MHDQIPARAAPPSTGSTGAGVAVRDVRRAFDSGVVALDGVNLDVPPGQFLAVLGPSGCGKSTLLRLIAGLDTPQGGTIALDFADRAGRSSRRSDVAYVFQDAHLLPWRTVAGNVALPLELMGVGAQRHAAAEGAIEQVGLAEAIGRYPAQLSGGMRMRVSLARALVTEPKLLLLDEPFAALDEITRQRLDEQLRDLWARRGMTVIFVTHSISEAAFLAQRAAVMSRRPGRIILDKAIDLPEQRTHDLRAEARFEREVRVLYEALKGEEPP